MINRRFAGAAAAVTVAAVVGAVVASAPPAVAAVGCRVDYAVSAQWAGGFTASITVHNLGDPVDGWRLGWRFTAGQAVTSSWGFTANPASGDVVATNVAYNAAIPTGGSVTAGFNGSWNNSANPVPTAFTLNGVACTGTTTTSTPTTTTTTTTPAAKPTVAADGTGLYRTVQAAIDAAPSNSSTRTVITIKPGTYRGVVRVPSNKTAITLQGLGTSSTQTVIVYNNSAGTHGTSGSASVFVDGRDFVATNLTIANDFDENSTSSGHQAVALHLNADRAVFRTVRLLGDQDTFLVNDNTRAYMADSYVEGTVDFIFGGGTMVFHRTSVYEKRATGGPITAASTPATKKYGLLFYQSTINGATANTTQLGRPWRPDAQVLYRESTLNATIKTSQPWTDMSGNTWQNARFLEYRNTGSGAGVNSNRPQLSDSLAVDYTPQKYLAGTDGWNPL
ncbi:MAG: cellulose-binding protein [Saccharothrix sp.]|nr:cellulose-binding protein [Saccharothrix sp.]